MAAFRSAPRGGRRLGWTGWLLGLAAAWSLPPAAGLLVLALASLTGRVAGSEAAMATLLAAGWLLVISPLLSWIWLALSVPPLWLLVRHGLAGWVNVAAVGAAAGALGAALVGELAPQTGILTGAFGAVIQRMVWGWIAPDILAPDRR